MTRPSRLLRRWGPVAACAATIFLFSSVPLQTRSRVLSIAGADKVLHLIEYGILGLLVCRAVDSADRGFWWKYAIVAIAFTVAYGIGDELHQHFTPGRVVDFWDVVADSSGAVLAALLWPMAARRRPGIRI